jgi:hypothetical protein
MPLPFPSFSLFLIRVESLDTLELSTREFLVSFLKVLERVLYLLVVLSYLLV